MSRTIDDPCGLVSSAPCETFDAALPMELHGLDISEGVQEADLGALFVHVGQVHQRPGFLCFQRRPDLGSKCLHRLGLARLLSDDD